MARILIIEDNPQLRKMLRQMLEKEGHTILEAEDGKVGCKTFRESPADLIITDLFMPVQDGLETIVNLKEDFPALKVIAISGGTRGGTFDFLPIAKSLGAVETLKKPFSYEDLLKTVVRVLNSN